MRTRAWRCAVTVLLMAVWQLPVLLLAVMLSGICPAADENEDADPPAATTAEQDISFQREIRPLLSDNCFYCHGTDSETRQADLRLDLADAAHEYALVSGDAEASEAFSRITTDDPDLQMPPPDSGKSLTAAEITLIRKWIESGAQYDAHWSFEPPRRPAVPAEAGQFSGWSRNPIDEFVLRRMLAAGLTPSSEASRAQWLRRVTLDLTGLPPTIDEQVAFESDHSVDAYEKVVDRLLNSHSFGERMAVQWLDAARYADTMGYQADWERFQWRWRSWVIDAYNNNLPFDQFTVEQLAGDLLPKPKVEQLIATGFNRNHRINDEGGIIPEEYLVEYIVDRVETTSATWMGLTMGCARCHDHKFDPFTQQDFYQLYAFFNAVPEQGKQGRKGYADPYMRVAVRGKQAKYRAMQDRVAEAQSAYDRRLSELTDQLNAWIEEQSERLEGQTANWQLIEPIELSAEGVTFRKLQDGSYLATGVSNDHPTYEIRFVSEEPIAAIRLEALTHRSLSKGKLSPGQGNFYLTDAELSGGDATIPWLRAVADYEQKGHPVASVIDDDPQTAWAVDGHAKTESRAAILFPDTTEKGETEFVLRLRFDSPHAKRIIGRIRLLTSSNAKADLDKNAGLPEAIAVALRKQSTKRSAADQKEIREYFAAVTPQMKVVRKDLQAARAVLKRFEDDFTTYVMVMREMEKPRPTYILNRGVYDQPAEQVFAAVPETVLGPLDGSLPKNRLGLAQWLVSGDHPLTARVIVNRYWAMLFGRGLVATIEDFGFQGAYPSHPELLDWLATEYPRIGWDTKALVKQMVLSSTYRQASAVTETHQELDPENKWLARASRIRLPAEMIRDSALASSGLLQRTIGGASVKPYQPEGLWSELSFASKSRTTDFYEQDTGASLYRRSLYTFWKRSVPPPSMATFDAPSRETCILQRSRTNTPLQSLALMNDTTYVEASRALAQRSLSNVTGDAGQRIVFAFRCLLGRHPGDRELAILEKGYQRRLEHFKQNPDDAISLISQGESKVIQEGDSAELAALTTSVMTIINLDEFVNRE